MQSVGLLARLNELDLVADATKARLAEVADALKEPGSLRAARRSLAQAESELAACAAVQREREAAQAQAAEKLARAESRLYSGQVKIPKELADAERDAQQLHRQLSQAEDQLLDALIAAEAAAAACNARRETLKQLAAEWAATQAGLLAEQARLTARAPAEQARQAAARQAAPADLLALYDALRSRRGGRAVARLEGDICSACRVAASPGVAIAARDAEELVCCENCGRILWSE